MKGILTIEDPRKLAEAIRRLQEVTDDMQREVNRKNLQIGHNLADIQRAKVKLRELEKGGQE